MELCQHIVLEVDVDLCCIVGSEYRLEVPPMKIYLRKVQGYIHTTAQHTIRTSNTIFTFSHLIVIEWFENHSIFHNYLRVRL